MVRAELGLSGVAAAAFLMKRQATVCPSLGQRGAASHQVLISVLLGLQLVHCDLVNICGRDLQQAIMCIERRAAAGVESHSHA